MPLKYFNRALKAWAWRGRISPSVIPWIVVIVVVHGTLVLFFHDVIPTGTCLVSKQEQFLGPFLMSWNMRHRLRVLAGSLVVHHNAAASLIYLYSYRRLEANIYCCCCWCSRLVRVSPFRWRNPPRKKKKTDAIVVATRLVFPVVC